MKNLSTSWRLLLAIGCIDLLFMMPIVMAYYQMKGIQLADFFLLQGLFRVAILVLEVPTGYLADRWNRTTQLTLGAACWLIGLSLVWQATSFNGVLLGEMFMALSVSLYSGTTQAYLHEALRHEKRPKEEPIWQGRLFTASTGAETIAGALGGLLFGWYVDAPIIGGIIAATCALAFTASLPQVPRDKKARRHTNPLYDLYLVAHHSLRVHPQLPWLLLGPKVLMGLTGVMFWVMLGKLNSLQLSPALLGFSFAAYMGIKAMLGLLSGKVAQLSHRLIFSSMLACLVGGCFLMTAENAWLVWLGGLLAAGIIHAVGAPLSTSLINREVADHERATVLSVGNMVHQVIGASYMLMAPFLLQRIGLDAMVLVLMTSTFLLSIYPLWRLTQNTK